MLKILGKVRNGILDVLFPAFCVSCGKEGRYVCEKCSVFLGEAALVCPACNEMSFSGERHIQCASRYGLDGLASCWEYEGVVKKNLGAIKYRGITHAVQELVKSSFQMMVADQARFGAFFEFLFTRRSPERSRGGEGGLPIITYVPMFKPKEKRRGFNQAEGIAKELAKMSGQKVVPLLKKIKDTSSQTELTKEQRLENVKNSFALQKTSFQMTEPHPPAGRTGSVLSARPGRASEDSFEKKFSSLQERVLLVDDIWTTGATMKECCEVLKKAGVKNVWGFTLARTP